jgi:hypothetical protein
MYVYIENSINNLERERDIDMDMDMVIEQGRGEGHAKCIGKKLNLAAEKLSDQVSLISEVLGENQAPPPSSIGNGLPI